MHRTLAATTALVVAPVAFTVAASSLFVASQQWFSHPYFSQGRWSWAWWLYLDASGTQKLWLAASGIGGAAVAFAIGRLLLMPSKSALYGKARWQTLWGAYKAGVRFGLTPRPDGIVLGKWGPLYASLPGEAHVSLTATTGAGKGVSFVVPNALNWAGPLFCFSVKRDVLLETAAERERLGRKVFVFDITDPQGHTHRWSGLGEVRRGSVDAYDDIQKAMFSIVPEVKASNPYWNDAARMVATGVGVMLAETPGQQLSIGNILKAIAQPDYDVRLREMITEAQFEKRPYPAAAVGAVIGWLDNQESDGGKAIRSTVITALSLWQIPRINAATSASDFDIGSVRTGDFDVFVCAQPSDIRRLRSIYGLFFNHLIEKNSRVDFKDLNPMPAYRTLVLLDERWSLGSMTVLDDATAFIRSFGFRLAVVLQTKDQMKMSLGQEGADNLFSNMGAELIFGGSDLKTCKEFSERAAYDTVEEASTSKPKFAWFSFNKYNENKSNKQRALILPQEIEALPKDVVLVKMKGEPLLKLKRIFWYKDRAFRAKSGDAPPMPVLKVEVDRRTGV